MRLVGKDGLRAEPGGEGSREVAAAGAMWEQVGEDLNPEQG